jgi:hypothetical protein
MNKYAQQGYNEALAHMGLYKQANRGQNVILFSDPTGLRNIRSYRTQFGKSPAEAQYPDMSSISPDAEDLGYLPGYLSEPEAVAVSQYGIGGTPTGKGYLRLKDFLRSLEQQTSTLNRGDDAEVAELLDRIRSSKHRYVTSTEDY